MVPNRKLSYIFIIICLLPAISCSQDNELKEAGNYSDIIHPTEDNLPDEDSQIILEVGNKNEVYSGLSIHTPKIKIGNKEAIGTNEDSILGEMGGGRSL